MNKFEYLQRLSKALKDYQIDNYYDVLEEYETKLNKIYHDNENVNNNLIIKTLGYPESVAFSYQTRGV